MEHRLGYTTKFILSLLEVMEDESNGNWEAYLNGRTIHMKRRGSETIFSPLTALYYHLTQKEIHRGSFWVEELVKEFSLDQWEILEISYAINAIDCSGHLYDRYLCKEILKRLEPLMKVDASVFQKAA